MLMLRFRHKLTSGEGFISIVFVFKAAWGKTIFLSSASTLLCLTLPWRHPPRQLERLTKINSEMLRGRHDALLVLCPSVTSCSELWFTLHATNSRRCRTCRLLTSVRFSCIMRQKTTWPRLLPAQTNGSTCGILRTGNWGHNIILCSNPPD